MLTINRDLKENIIFVTARKSCCMNLGVKAVQAVGNNEIAIQLLATRMTSNDLERSYCDVSIVNRQHYT